MTDRVATEHDALELGIAVLEREIDVSGPVLVQRRNFALNPDIGQNVVTFQHVPNVSHHRIDGNEASTHGAEPGVIRISGDPYSTGWPLVARMAVTSNVRRITARLDRGL